jgi:uncharacterized protein involved in outer membrane biogenesis
MKWIRRILLVSVLLIVAVVGIAYVSLNSIICSAIQRQATASLGVQTTLASAHLSILGGKIDLEDLQVSSPPKFAAPKMFTLGGISVSVRYGQLTAAPIHIQQIIIDHPALVIEQSNIQLNLQALMHQSPQPPQTSGGQTTQPIKLVIDELDLNDAQVTFMPGIPGLADSIQVPISSMVLKDIGNADGNQTGAAINEVILQTSTALAGKAVADSKLSPPVKLILSQELAAVSTQLGSGFDAQFKNLAGSVTNDLAPKLQGTLDKLLSGNKKSPPN